MPSMPSPGAAEILAGMGAGDQVFLDRQILEDPPALEYLGDAALDDIVRRQPVDPLPVEFDRALGDLAALGAQQAGYRLQGRRLAGAVGAEEGGDASLLGTQRHAFQHQDHAVIDDLDVVERQHRATARRDPGGSCPRLIGGLDRVFDNVAIGAEPVGLLDELAVMDLEDLDPAAALVVGRGDLQRRHKTAQGEVVDLFHAFLDLSVRSASGRR